MLSVVCVAVTSFEAQDRHYAHLIDYYSSRDASRTSIESPDGRWPLIEFACLQFAICNLQPAVCDVQCTICKCSLQRL